VVAVLVALAAGLTACQATGGTPAPTASAVFSDVDDLVPGAQVQMADIPVGQVQTISLDGDRARVTMIFSPGTHVPANVVASVDRTTILGENFIELSLPRGTRAVGQLADGARIRRTAVVPDVEQLVSAGSQFFGAISTSELAQIIEAGGQGFGGQQANLRQLLNDFSDVTAGYASRTQDIKNTITSLNRLGTSLAPASSTDAQALTTLSQTVGVLAAQSDRFTNLLSALNAVSVQGRSLLETYLPQIDDQLHAAQAVVTQVAQHQQDLAGLLQELPQHNAVLASAVRNDYAQLLENLIVCGLPGGGESSAPAFTCAPQGGGG
jgi:phospholipid/cholesterol/gamma-HCH transport system substrate-binding protein